MMIPGRRQHIGISRACFGMLLILALMLRASIPDGFMPSAGKAGMAHMTICPGVAGMAQDEGKKNHGPSHSSPCAYTLVLAHHAPEQAAVLQAPDFSATKLFPLSEKLAETAAIKPWLSRGPPHFLA